MIDTREMTYQELRAYLALHSISTRSRKRRALEAAVRRHRKQWQRARRVTFAPKREPTLPRLEIGDTPLTARRARPYRHPLPVYRQ